MKNGRVLSLKIQPFLIFSHFLFNLNSWFQKFKNSRAKKSKNYTLKIGTLLDYINILLKDLVTSKDTK